ncbi:GGDEF domain-containing protein [Aeromonas aquatica]|uniref:GGDEF domain-containing protein n=1 Tax=Aeromonas aquatica TaxID=558964 RepID=UPI0013776CDE|nr:GGDEF domain-containing protein [Aeromonas aquatica]
MKKTPLRLSVHPAIFLSLPLCRRAAMAGQLCLLLLTAALFTAGFDRLAQHNLYTIGALAEVINVLTLLFMFWVVQCAQLSSKSYGFLSVGLCIWLVSGVIDLMDEAYFQPWWLSRVEDSLRSLGMLATAWGVLLMVQQMYGAQIRLASMAMSDELTGLSNRRSFRTVLDTHAGEGTPLLLLDLDHFKQINDRYGHGVGDNVLREFSGLLRQHCPPDGVVARLGGEEFAIWLPGMLGGKARDLAEQIRLATEAMVSNDGVRFTVSIAVGISHAGEAVDTLIKRTDLALYQAKHQGRNRVELA